MANEIKVVVEKKATKTALENSIAYWKRHKVNVINASYKELPLKDGSKKKFQVFKTDSKTIPELVFARGCLRKSWS
jgi:hypothetical protein